MSVVILVGRIPFSIIFIGAGWAGHIMQTEGTAAYAESRGVPNSKMLTRISGIGIMLGGLAVGASSCSAFWLRPVPTPGS